MFDIHIEPNSKEFINDLIDEVDDYKDSFLKFLSKHAPNEMRNLMNQSSPTGKLYARADGSGFTRSHHASAKGQTPAKDNLELYNSLSGSFSGGAAEVEMAEHAKNLDPFFGGYLNRPFIDEAIDTSINKGMQQIK